MTFITIDLNDKGLINPDFLYKAIALSDLKISIYMRQELSISTQKLSSSKSLTVYPCDIQALGIA